MDYVCFECVHYADANQNDPNECQALAYADIDGYPADENKEGTVICRVWLLRKKEGIYPTYLVDWHYNAYRMNKIVLELIAEVKKDLLQYKESMLKNLFQDAYGRYKLKWMLDHKYTLNELCNELQTQLNNGAKNIEEAFNNFESGKGFQGELWIYDEFHDTKWKDADYMREILTSDEYAIWSAQ